MQVEWYGQSAFRLSTPDTTVFIDPIGDVSGLAGRGLQFDYPPVEGVAADLLLVTHEHMGPEIWVAARPLKPAAAGAG